MLEIVEVLVASAPDVLADHEELLRRIDAAYPFGERRYHPYKMWLEERRLLRDALNSSPLPSREESEVCQVAFDLVEVGRVDDARKLLEEQAPNRLSRECPACGAKAKRPCADIGDAYEVPFIRVVPHLARVGVYRDHGPLFQGDRK